MTSQCGSRDIAMTLPWDYAGNRKKTLVLCHCRNHCLRGCFLSGVYLLLIGKSHHGPWPGRAAGKVSSEHGPCSRLTARNSGRRQASQYYRTQEIPKCLSSESSPNVKKLEVSTQWSNRPCPALPCPARPSPVPRVESAGSAYACGSVTSGLVLPWLEGKK